MCLYPKLINNPKYKETAKNGGNIPTVSDLRTLRVPIGCGRCIECMKQKAMQWKVRLQEDIRENKNAKFIALTFNNDSYKAMMAKTFDKFKKYNINTPSGYELDNQIATTATRLFLERHRKKYKKSLRHWLVTELGHNGTENIHMHGIIWTDIDLDEIERIWSYGYMWKYKMINGQKVNYVNERTINYITKYVTKLDEQHKHYKPIILTSAGIGKNYINRKDSKANLYNGENTIEYYKTRTGTKLNLPIYYRNKLYTDEEKEKLWINKLNKNERWVLGQKIDTSEGYEEYFSVLKSAQEKNKRLGYGDDKKNWKEINYEKQLRILKQQERIKKPSATPTRGAGNSRILDCIAGNEETKPNVPKQ